MIKFARWPQPLGILSIGAYLRQHNPGVNVEVLDGNNVLPLDEVIDQLDADVVGITATAVGYEYAVKIAEPKRSVGSLRRGCGNTTGQRDSQIL